MANENENERDDDERDEDEREGEESPRASASDAEESDSDESVGDVSPEEQDRIAAREEAEIRREEERLAEGGSEHEVAPLAGMMGVERWVQFSFIALGGLVIFIGDKLIEGIWGYFAEPDPTIVSGSAALLGIVVAFLAYRHPRANELAHEVVGELSKVTWPTRDETYYSTVVVIVTSVIAAVYTGVFDAVWSAFTDLIYNV